MKTSKPLLTLRMLFPVAASFIVLLLGEWIARGSLTADTFISFIFPHFGAYLLAWLLLFLVWELLDWVLRIPLPASDTRIGPVHRDASVAAVYRDMRGSEGRSPDHPAADFSFRSEEHTSELQSR